MVNNLLCEVLLRLLPIYRYLCCFPQLQNSKTYPPFLAHLSVCPHHLHCSCKLKYLLKYPLLTVLWPNSYTEVQWNCEKAQICKTVETNTIKGSYFKFRTIGHLSQLRTHLSKHPSLAPSTMRHSQTHTSPHSSQCSISPDTL